MDRRLPGEGLPHDLFALTYHIERRIRPYFRELKLHWGLRRILQRLWVQDGLSQKELSIQVGSSEASVSNLLKHLIDKQLVERRQDAYDYRIWRVYLTARGEALGHEIEAELGRLDALMRDALGEDDANRLQTFLDALQQTLSSENPGERERLGTDYPSPPGEL